MRTNSDDEDSFYQPLNHFHRTKENWKTQATHKISSALKSWDRRNNQQLIDEKEKINLIKEAFKVFPGLYEHTKDPTGDLNMLLNLDLKYSTEAEKQYCFEYLKSIQSVLLVAIQTRLTVTFGNTNSLQEVIKLYEMLKAKTTLDNISDGMVGSGDSKNTSNNSMSYKTSTNGIDNENNQKNDIKINKNNKNNKNNQIEKTNKTNKNYKIMKTNKNNKIARSIENQEITDQMGKVSKQKNQTDKDKELTLKVLKVLKKLQEDNNDSLYKSSSLIDMPLFLDNLNSNALESDFVDYKPLNLKYDSGALRTVVGNKKLLTNYDTEEQQIFELPNGQKIRSHGSGDLVIKVNHHELVLKDAHYIPGFKINLVSCGQITSQGYDVILSHKMLLCVNFNGKHVIFAKQSLDTNLFTGPSSGTVYSNGKMYMDNNSFIDYEGEEKGYLNSINAMTKLVDPRIDQVVANPDGRKDIYYYHLITGHMSIRALTRLQEQGKIKCSVDDQDAKQKIKGCKQCILVNAKQHSHNKTTQAPPERSLYRFHCDTMGPYHVGHVKFYITLLTDHYSGFSFAIVKAEKRFTVEIMQLLKHLHSDLYPKKIARFRSDNAKEFPTEAELGSLNIKKEVLPPYSPEMNGMAESHNNILKKRMLYVMLNFPNRYKELLIFFCEIVAYAVFIKNHTPSERVETRKGWTPHELFYNRRYRPNYHQFGVDVFVILLNKQEADALGVQFIKGFHRGVPGIFLGYGNDSNVYLIQLVDGNYTRRLFVNVRFLGSMNNINTFLDTFGNKMRKTMEESGNSPFFEDSSKNELLNGRYVPYEDHLPVQGTSPQDVSSEKPTTIQPTAPITNMDDLIAEVPEEFLQNNIAGDFLTQQGFTFPQLQVTGELLEHQSKQSLAPYNWMSTDNLVYLKMGSDHKYSGQNDTDNVGPNENKQVNSSEPSFQSSMADKPNELDHGVLPTADGIHRGVSNAWGETTQDGTASSNIDMHQPYTTIPTHRPPPPVGENVQFLGVNNDSRALLPSEWGLPPQQHLSNGGAYESLPVSKVTTSVRTHESLPVSNVTTSVRLSDSTMKIDVGKHSVKRRRIERHPLLPNKETVNEISVRIKALKNEHKLNQIMDNITDSYLFTKSSELENKNMAYYNGIGRVSKPPMLLNNLKIIDELIPPTKHISSIETKLDTLAGDLNNIEDDIDLSVYGVEKYVDLNDENWKRSMDKEMKKFKDMNVYQVVKKKKNFRLIPAKWVHTYKPEDPKGEFFKSRCVVQGFRQIAGVDFDKNCVLSPVTDLTTIRVLTAIAVEEKSQIQHIDIKSAYLNASLPKNTPIYIKPPPGYDDNVHCWRLVKAVYGLKQAGFEWHAHLSSTFKKMGLTQCDGVEGLFMLERDNKKIYIALYVDDLFVVASTNQLFNEFMDDLEAKFSLNYIGEILEYLGIEFQKNGSGYELHQNKFVKRLIEAFPTEILKGADLPRTPDNSFKNGKHKIIDDKTGKPSKNQKDIPIPDEYIYEEIDSPSLDKEHHDLYRSIVGMLLWLTSNTMPSISYATNALAVKCHQPTENDYKHLMQMIKYLYTNDNERLIMRRNQTKEISEENYVIYAYSDASFAADLDRHSVSGFAVYLNGNIVSWGTKRQRSITVDCVGRNC